MAQIRLHRIYPAAGALFMAFLRCLSWGGLHEPFQAPPLMGTMGTILYENSSAARAPFISSVFLAPRSNSAGIGASAVTYYDAMDNYADRHLATLTAGGWFTHGRWSGKAAFMQFDALGAYYEQSGYLSAAMALFHDIRFGIEATGCRAALSDPKYDPVTTAFGGVELLVPVRPVIVTFAVRDIVVKQGRSEGVAPDLRIECGIHSARHAFGAQGLLLSITPVRSEPVSIALGQEVRLHKAFAVHAALHSNPFLVSIGIELQLRKGAAAVAMVNHPVLGWSRGVSAQYFLRRPVTGRQLFR